MAAEDGSAVTGMVMATDPDGLASTDPYSVTADPANGVATVAADGSWSYTPEPNFTGIDSDYEAPENPEVDVDSGSLSVDECVEKILEKMN